MQGKDILGMSSKEDDWKRSGRETGKAGCRSFPVLERILVRPRLTVRDHGGRRRSRGPEASPESRAGRSARRESRAAPGRRARFGGPALSSGKQPNHRRFASLPRPLLRQFLRAFRRSVRPPHRGRVAARQVVVATPPKVGRSFPSRTGTEVLIWRDHRGARSLDEPSVGV